MDPAKTATESRRERPGRVRLLLGLAAALGGLLVLDQWANWGGGAPEERAGTAIVATVAKDMPAAVDLGAEAGAAGSDRGAHPLASLALDELGDTVRRPLFEKKRRPVEPPPRAVPSPAPPAAVPRGQADPNALTLQGIVLNEGRSAIALMRRSQTGQSVRLQEGDTVDGWTVERIEAERVHLVHRDTRIALELFRKR